MKRRISAWMGLVLFLLSGCGAQAVETAEKIPCEKIHVALTFDDGPNPELTPQLLEGLAERGVHATFFVVGKLVEENRELVKQMTEKGHQIGNHSYDHAQLDQLSGAEALRDIGQCDTLLQDILGPGIYWVRPPYGSISENCCVAVAAPLARWTVDPEDWRVLNTALVVGAVEDNIFDGCIILLHDQYPTTVEAALQIIDDLQAQGVVFCTLDELFCAHGIKPQLGQIYRNA